MDDHPNDTDPSAEPSEAEDEEERSALKPMARVVENARKIAGTPIIRGQTNDSIDDYFQHLLDEWVAPPLPEIPPDIFDAREEATPYPSFEELAPSEEVSVPEEPKIMDEKKVAGEGGLPEPLGESGAPAEAPGVPRNRIPVALIVPALLVVGAVAVWAVVGRDRPGAGPPLASATVASVIVPVIVPSVPPPVPLPHTEPVPLPESSVTTTIPRAPPRVVATSRAPKMAPPPSAPVPAPPPPKPSALFESVNEP